MFAVSLAVVNSDSAINGQKVQQEKATDGKAIGEQQQKTKEEKVNSRPNANLKMNEQPKERPFFQRIFPKLDAEQLDKPWSSIYEN
ncbi:hypothetical protein niasHS_007662 [Heterodera schachtii]|uniref:Uncharacterized protein n=1 Tax=Heterodera schachtii TaxID=97005 RepID=A0ABD2JPU5_HETSC